MGSPFGVFESVVGSGTTTTWLFIALIAIAAIIGFLMFAAIVGLIIFLVVKNNKKPPSKGEPPQGTSY